MVIYSASSLHHMNQRT